MSVPCVIELASGFVDGLNRDFYTSVSYVTGSIEVFLNGQAKRKDWADGWLEMGSNHVRLKQAPAPGDVVQVYFRPL